MKEGRGGGSKEVEWEERRKEEEGEEEAREKSGRRDGGEKTSVRCDWVTGWEGEGGREGR